MKRGNLVSIVIPTKNSSKTLDQCLKSIKIQTIPNLEIIVVDNNSIDNTKEIAKKFTNHVFNKGPERSVQRNYGAKKSKGKYIMFIDSDMVLSKNVVRDCLKKATTEKLGALIIPEASFGEGFWAKCKTLERSFYLGVKWIESARFFERKLFFEFKGYDVRNTGTEDFDLPQRIKKRKGEDAIGRIKSKVRHYESNLSLLKSIRKKYYYAQKLPIYKIENELYFKKQSNILDRYILYFSKPKKLFKDPLVGIGMIFMKTSEFTAGGIGYFLAKMGVYK